MQIQQTAVQSQRALSVSVQQTAAKERERRILQLTIDEIGQIEGDVNLYKGVGRMCVRIQFREMSCSPLSMLHRFMIVPRKEMEGDLKTQEKEISDDIASLNKKVGADY